MVWPTGIATAQDFTGGSGEKPRAALLTTNVTRSGPEAERDAALDTVVHGAVDELGVVDVVARPALDLESIQLSIDCVGETAPCLLAVADKVGAQVLVAPGIQRTDSELVLSILYFDSRTSELRRVARRQPGDTLQTETLDAVPAMLRELFQLPPEEPPPAAAEPAPLEVPPPDVDYFDLEEQRRGRGVPVGPVLLGGGGLLTLGAGIFVGLAMQDTEDEYAGIDVTNPDQAERADDKLDTGRNQALVANLLIGAGSAALVASAIWLAVELTDDGTPSETALAPALGPDYAGLVVRGAWESSR